MATFQRSPQATHDLLVQVIQECYPDLEELMSESERIPLTFDLLDVFADLDANGEPVGPAIKSGGYPVAAQISIVPKAQRALGHADVLIKIDADGWKNLPDDRRAGLLDHELMHLIPSVDKEDNWKKDDLGHQRFTMREHDVQVGWFIEVAKRRGAASPEVKQAKMIADKWGQILFFFADTPPLAVQPEAKGRGKKAEAAVALPKPEPEQEEREGNGPWMLWEQLDGAQQEAATELLGDRLNTRFQFRTTPEGGLEQSPLAEGELPASEQEAPAAAEKTPRARKPRGAKK